VTKYHFIASLLDAGVEEGVALNVADAAFAFTKLLDAKALSLAQKELKDLKEQADILRARADRAQKNANVLEFALHWMQRNIEDDAARGSTTADAEAVL
jgi:hypothetical protein